LNVHGRTLLIQRVVVEERPPAHVAKELGISRQCAYRWVNRFKAEGLPGLEDRSSRPHTSPTRTPDKVEDEVLAARQELKAGPDRISEVTGVPARTVTRILHRHDIPRLAQTDPVTGALIRASKVTAVRYERERPGELVHMDVKKIGRIREGGGWRVHGRQMGSTGQMKRNRVGFDYVHSLIDDHSRLAYSEVLDDEKGPTCAGFLARAAAWMISSGIPRIERVMTDNHWSYKRSNDVAAVIADLDARHVFIRPHCPWQNGKVERFNRTLQTEWAYRQAFTSNTERTQALAPWLQTYNNQRSHHALSGHPPISRVLSPTS
jgi:transposase InsO family protein